MFAEAHGSFWRVRAEAGEVGRTCAIFSDSVEAWRYAFGFVRIEIKSLGGILDLASLVDVVRDEKEPESEKSLEVDDEDAVSVAR